MRTIIAATLLLAVAAQADDSNYRNTLIGERAFGLAGTFTALADDSSGIFYNPAGIVDANKDSFSLSASVYTLQNMTLKKAFAPLDSNLQEDIESSTFSSVPSTVGSLSKLNERVTVGFNTIVLDQREVKIDDMARLNDPTIAYTREAMFIRDTKDQILLIGPGLGLRLSDMVSVGLAGFYVMRTFEDKTTWGDKVARRSNNEAIKVQSISQGIKLETGSLVGLLGVKLNLSHHLKLGATARTRSWRVRESGKITSAISTYYRPDLETALANDDDEAIYANKPHFGSRSDGISSSARMPYKLALGIAYEKKLDFTVTMDLNYFNGYRFNLLTVEGWEDSTVPLGRVDQDAVLNSSFGCEYFFHKAYPLRFGIYTNFSSAPKVKEGDYSTQEHIDIIGGTLSVGKEDPNYSTTLGLAGSYGWGRSPLPIVAPDTDIQSLEVTTSSVSLLLSGSYYF